MRTVPVGGLSRWILRNMAQESDAQMSRASVTFKTATLRGWLSAQEVIGLSYLVPLSSRSARATSRSAILRTRGVLLEPNREWTFCSEKVTLAGLQRRKGQWIGRLPNGNSRWCRRCGSRTHMHAQVTLLTAWRLQVRGQISLFTNHHISLRHQLCSDMARDASVCSSPTLARISPLFDWYSVCRLHV